MRKNFLCLFNACLLPLSLFLFSCSGEKDVISEEDVVIEGDYVESALWTSDEKVAASTWISPSVPSEFAAAVRRRVDDVVNSSDDAVVVVTDSRGYNPDELGDGRIAIVYDPSAGLVQGFGENAGEKDILCVGLQKNGGHFLVGEPEDDSDLSASLNSLVGWINYSTRSSANGFIKDDDSYGASYTGEIYNKICNVALSKPDYLRGKYDIGVRVDVTPLHGFESSGTNKAMDYYIVTLTTTVQSKGMYSGNFTKKHGGVKARICGYYLKNLNIEASVTNSKGKSVPGVFFQSVPTPATTQGATTYTTSSGFNYQGGISTGPNIVNSKFGYTHSSSQSRTISDCEIINNHNNDVVKFQYKINNLPSYNTGGMRINNPPNISVSTAVFYSQWIWAVPTADNDENTEYCLKISLQDFIYGASYFYSSKADYHNLDFKIDNEDVLLKLRKPVRYPVGSVKILNNIKGCYLTYVSYQGKKMFEETGNQYKYQDTCVTYLPQGEYVLKCRMKGRDAESSGKTCDYTYKNKVNVLMGETIVRSTSEKEFEKE